MWLPNLVMGLLGVALFVYVSFDLRVTRPLTWLTRKLKALRHALSCSYAHR